MNQQLELFRTYDGREIAYRIYPSLLDKYQQLLDYEEEAEKPWNKWTPASIEKAKTEYLESDFPIAPWIEPVVGDYILTPEEKYDEIEQELIDMINRKPHAPMLAADRGTAFNEVIDCLILNKPCQREDMTIESLRSQNVPFAIRADYNGFSFVFDLELCRAVKSLLGGAVCQYLIEAPIRTKYGDVLLYGYLDYWLEDKIIDLKTTGKYDFGNYERKWQKSVYPYCAIESGLTNGISEFDYLVVQMGKGKVITGTVYNEAYSYDHESNKIKLQEHIESFIDFIERNRDRITNRKIFNQE